MLLLHNQISKIKRQGSPFLSCTLFVNFWSLLAKSLENWYLPLVQGLLNLDFWFKYYSGYILELTITVNKAHNGFKQFGLWYSYWKVSIVSAVYIFLIQCDTLNHILTHVSIIIFHQNINLKFILSILWNISWNEIAINCDGKFFVNIF